MDHLLNTPSLAGAPNSDDERSAVSQMVSPPGHSPALGQGIEVQLSDGNSEASVDQSELSLIVSEELGSLENLLEIQKI